jgi:hypothetical protein
MLRRESHYGAFQKFKSQKDISLVSKINENNRNSSPRIHLETPVPTSSAKPLKSQLRNSPFAILSRLVI